MAGFLAAAASKARETALSQIPQFIEKYEPQMESTLKTALTSMPPEETALFLTNWKKLDSIVRSTLEPSPAPVGGKRLTKKRTHKRKHRRS